MTFAVSLVIALISAVFSVADVILDIGLACIGSASRAKY